MPRKRQPGQHGGVRQGTPGKAYANRTDLQQATQPVRVAPSQQYGEATAQAAAQKALPLPGPGAGAPPSPPAAGPGSPPVLPGQLGPLTAPTNRPNEPITAGLPTGPGPGPEALGAGGMNPIDEVRAMYAADPNDDMRRLLAYLDGY